MTPKNMLVSVIHMLFSRPGQSILPPISPDYWGFALSLPSFSLYNLTKLALDFIYRYYFISMTFSTLN